MKRILFSVFAAVILFAAFSFRTAPVEPTPKIIKTFNEQFRNASNVVWKEIPEGFTASFNFNGSKCLAFFDEEGELSGTGRLLSFRDLPLPAMRALDIRFAGASFYNIIEFTGGEDCFYLVHAQTAFREYKLRVYSNGYIFVEHKDKIRITPSPQY